jgi:predicted ABC-type ATPase
MQEVKNRLTFTLIAGINGAGKSTAYNFMSDEEKDSLGIRVNPDELALKFGSVIIGGKEAIKLRAYCFCEKISFHQETTFTGKSILKTIDEAKSKGYTLNLIYVSVDSAETAISRVANRVKFGGHDIPTDSIIKRYPESLKNLAEQIHKFDSAKLVDNTQNFSTLFRAIDKKIIYVSDDLPEWAHSAVEEYQKHIQECEENEGILQCL